MRNHILTGAAVAAVLGAVFGFGFGPDIARPRAEPMAAAPVIATPEPATSAEPVIVPAAYQPAEEVPLHGHPWIAAGSRGCATLMAGPYVYIDTIRADGVRVDILSEGPNHVTIGDTSKSRLPVQVIVRGMGCQQAQQALAVMRTY